MKLKIDISIPVYNEKDNIRGNLDGLALNLQGAEDDITLKIIYDFQDDDTLPVVRDMADDFPFPVEYVYNEKGGVLNAIKKAFDTKAEYVVISMADQSDDYKILKAMFGHARAGSDIVCASRYMKGGKLYGGPFFKQLLSRLSGITLHLLTRIPTHDITNSFKLYKKSIITEIETESTGGFEIGMEITAKAYLKGHKITEIPARWWDRTEGESKFKFSKWLPKYMKWYFYLIKGKWFGKV